MIFEILCLSMGFVPSRHDYTPFLAKNQPLIVTQPFKNHHAENTGIP
jgi:hypothetical protein